jgi:hypothetical protein
MNISVFSSYVSQAEEIKEYEMGGHVANRG